MFGKIGVFAGTPPDSSITVIEGLKLPSQTEPDPRTRQTALRETRSPRRQEKCPDSSASMHVTGLSPFDLCEIVISPLPLPSFICPFKCFYPFLLFLAVFVVHRSGRSGENDVM